MEEMPSHIRLGITQYHLLDSLDRSRDNKQQELTSLILETPLPQRDSCNRLYRTVRSVGKQANRLFVQHNIKEVNNRRIEAVDCDPVSRRRQEEKKKPINNNKPNEISVSSRQAFKASISRAQLLPIATSC